MSTSQTGSIPAKIGKYDVVDIVGRGGMGIVYRGRDARLNRSVAIKTLNENFSGNPEMLKRFYHEASQTSALCHANIVLVYDAGDQDGMPYIVMEYVEGETFDTLLQPSRAASLQFRLNIVEQVCVALAYAHRNGVVHRDVKPANIIVQRDGTAKLLDFGIARAEQRPLDQNLTNTGMLIGTPSYMAPERLRGESADGRSDIFSTGVLLYQAVARKLPFDADFPASMQQILNENPKPLSEWIDNCPDGLEAVVARALAKNPADRYDYADDMASELRAIIATTQHAHVAELFAEAQALFSKESYQAAQEVLRRLAHLDHKHVEAKRLLSLAEQRLLQQGRNKRAEDLVRSAQNAGVEKDWDRALKLCNEARELYPACPGLAEVLRSATEGKERRTRIAQLLAETNAARKAGDLEAAKAHAEAACKLDPQNSQMLALYRVVKQEATEQHRKQELASLLSSARSALEERRFDSAAGLLEKAEAGSPHDAEVLRCKDQLAAALREEKRRTLVRTLEEKMAVAATLEALQSLAGELGDALQEFPSEASLLSLRLELLPYLAKLEEDAYVKDLASSLRGLTPPDALARIREGLVRVPGNEQLLALESRLVERSEHDTAELRKGEFLAEARRAMDDHRYSDAVKILERCQAASGSTAEMQRLMDLARSAASRQSAQQTAERTSAEARSLLDKGDSEAAIQLLTRALQQAEEPGLRKLLESVQQKQRQTQQKATEVLQQASAWTRMELWEEAVSFLEEQPAEVRAIPQVAEALALARKLEQEEAAFCSRWGTVYASLGTPRAVELLSSTLRADPGALESSSKAAARTLLQKRAGQFADSTIHSACGPVREALERADSQRAEMILAEVAPWTDYASVPRRAELQELREEVANARKAHPFRRSQRRQSF